MRPGLEAGAVIVFGSPLVLFAFANGLVFALVLLWRPTGLPLPVAALSDAGWTIRQVRWVGWGVSAFVAGLVFALFFMVGEARAAVLASMSVAVWLPAAALRVICFGALTGESEESESALRDWLFEIRLLVACGAPVNAAASMATRQVRDPAFDVVRSTVAEAVVSGADPLRFTAERLAGRPIAPVIAAIESAERAGAATTGLLDQVLARAGTSLENRRREKIDRLSGAVGTATMLLTISTVVLMMMALVFTLDF